MRGLDYYTRTTFEFKDEAIGAKSTICGGGRYDGLVEAIGGPPTPGIGFGAGIERLLLSVGDARCRRPSRSTRSSSSTKAPIGPSVLATMARAPSARASRADTDYAGRSKKGQLTQAGRLGATPTVIVDAEGVRIVASGGDEPTTLDELAARLGAMSWRDLRCGEPRPEHEGREVTLAGWAARRRDHGGLVFIDLRDESGVTQLVLNPEHAPRGDGGRARRPQRVRAAGARHGRQALARDGEPEDGDRRGRGAGRGADRAVGVARRCPFQLDEENVDEALRMKYRWLDLRREHMQRNIRVARAARPDHPRGDGSARGSSTSRRRCSGSRRPRARATSSSRRVCSRASSTRCRSRRRSRSSCSSISGFERYYQIARCMRDEDPRADRLQELTQLDVEMAFPDREFIFALMERIVTRIWRECIGVELEAPFQRMTYDEAMLRFGIDRPDLRFGMEIQEADRHARLGVRRVRKRASRCATSRCRRSSRAPRCRRSRTRRSRGARRGSRTSSSAPTARSLRRSRSFSRPSCSSGGASRGTRCSSCADEPRLVAKVLGLLRLQLGRELGLVDESLWKFLWVVDMPSAEWDEQAERWIAAHHPFTRPTDDSIEIFKTDPGAARAVAYDLVGNGIELAGGSFRIHEPWLQQQVFENLGIGAEEQREKFGFLLDALAMGAPPHGGIASGIDRLTMALLGEPYIRDTQAFPKNQAGYDYMTEAPIELSEEQLEELGLRVVVEADVT